MKLILTCLIFLSGYGLYAQEALEWKVYVDKISDDLISEDGYYYHNTGVQTATATAVIENEIWKEIAPMADAAVPKPGTVSISIAMQRKEPRLIVRIPVFREKAGKQQRLQSFTIKISDKEKGRVQARPSYPSNSVLASGTWYKIGVTQRGVHRIDAAFLTAVGLDPSAINPTNIRIYGNGGQVMTEVPDDSEPNDLVENAIFVSASGSTFGAGDYILFYADGPRKWTYSEYGNKFMHTNNYYSDTAFYFINVDKGPGKRITTVSESGTPVATYDRFNDYAVIDEDSVHHSTLGKVWWSHQMFTQVPSTLTKNVTLSLTNPVDSITIDYHVGSTIAAGSVMQVFQGADLLEDAELPGFGQYGRISRYMGTLQSIASGPDIQFTLKLLPGGASGIGLLDYILVNGMSHLDFAGKTQLNFRNAQSKDIDAADLVAYRIANASGPVTVWDVTNKLEPRKVATTLSGTTLTAMLKGGKINELIAFNTSGYKTPFVSKKIGNQNLHALPSVPFIIITTDEFIPVAQDIAALHAEIDGISTHIVTTEKIYNEFSSGSQDIAGIRNFLRMFYDRASGSGQVPENVLMLGAASYDYKNRIEGNTNFVPNHQSYRSWDMSNALSTDDYFVLLDSMEALGSSASLFDMGIGRIPITNLDEGKNIVNKIRNYLSPKSFGPWKNTFSFVSDNADGAGHFSRDSETMGNALTSSSPNYNLVKLYGDVYPREPSASGFVLPKLTNDLNNQIFLGTFLMNYTGHGSPRRLADENILTIDDINSWRNIDKLPVIITGTCDFGRYDNPGEQSGGKLMFLKADGGSIASITTTQLVYSGATTSFLTKYMENQFNRTPSGDWPTMGMAMLNGKNNSLGAADNNIKYVLLGDPALKLALPKYEVTTDSLLVYTSESVTALTDTVSALGNYILKGAVRNAGGFVIPDFNGTVYITVMDKPQSNAITPNAFAPTFTSYKTQNSIIFRGQAKVENGLFTVRMIIPKDINYDFGKGKISYYAQSAIEDASGTDTSIMVGGFAEYIKEDNEPPVVKPSIDDPFFTDGGVTGPDPMLYVELYDDNGINVSGSSIGHDLIAVLDGNTASPFILNNYYYTDSVDFGKGYVQFPMAGLSEGWHEIKVRAWDVYNNSGEGTVRFRVVNKDKGAISEVYNYPNPIVNGYTTFVIQHNLSNLPLDVDIHLFDASGRKVRTLNNTVPPGANRLEISWDGGDDQGLGLGGGVYHYKVEIRSEDVVMATAYNKLVLVR